MAVDADATETLRRMLAQGWDGLVVVDGPRTVATVSLAQSLRLLLPDYVETRVVGGSDLNVTAGASHAQAASDIVAALLWLGIMAFAVWLLGWSMNFWWYLGTL